LGLEAYNNRFFFDFSPTYVGVGMIYPYIVNVFVLLGGILSWGLMWPLIAKKKGSWYPANLEDSSLHGLQAYRVFISIALILGDGLYNFIKVLIRTIAGFISMVQQNLKVMLHVWGKLNLLSSNIVLIIDYFDIVFRIEYKNIVLIIDYKNHDCI
jgi:uncharacterized oligopeptide transporter (OPT) family protein